MNKIKRNIGILLLTIIMTMTIIGCTNNSSGEAYKRGFNNIQKTKGFDIDTGVNSNNSNHLPPNCTKDFECNVTGYICSGHKCVLNCHDGVCLK